MQRRYSIQSILVGVLVAVAIGAILAGIFFSGDERRKSLRAVRDAATETVDFDVRDFRYSQVGDADVHWEVRADRAWYKKRDQKVHLEQVAIKLVSLDGEIHRMTGDRGILDNESGDMELAGTVIVTFDGGEQLMTDVLRYRSSERLVYTDCDVVLTRDAIRITGRGMTFALEENRLVLSSQVKAVIANASLFSLGETP